MIGDEVVVAEARTAFAGHEAVFRQSLLAGSGACLVDHVLHVVRRQELPLLDVHRLARLRHGADEIGLAAQERRRLQHVDHLRGGGDVVLGVDVGEHRHAQLAPHGGQDLQALLAARTAKGRAGGAVGLVEAALEDERDAQRGRDLLELAGDVHLQLLGFDHAGTGDEEEGLVEPDVESAEFHATAFSAFF
jgi:hypothetical protein